MTTLFITNGDSAVEALRRAGFTGEFLPWRDVLHEGPVPAGLSLDDLRPVRVGFLAAQGWGMDEDVLAGFTQRDAALAGFREHAEVVLWFEHDLYDQLQLIQLLDWFAGQAPAAANLSLICTAEYVGLLGPERLQELYAARHSVTPVELALGQAAWRAFRAPDPAQLSALLAGDTAALPFLRAALLRHLQEYPSVGQGLSRTERQILETVAAGPKTLREVYPAAHHAREAEIFLGDTVFAGYMAGLSREAHPLLRLDEPAPALAQAALAEGAAGDPFWSRTTALTDAGRQVLEGRQDRVALNGIDRWLGGVHLQGGLARWRWDEAAQALARPA